MVRLNTGKVERNLEHVSIKDIKEIKAVNRGRAIRHLNIRGIKSKKGGLFQMGQAPFYCY